jgi:hypothetical protein
MTSSFKQLQTERNLESRSRWQQYTKHRQHIQELLLHYAPHDGRILFLGAGNCNDLNLDALSTYFKEVHLLDIDGDALAAGLAMQGQSSNPSIFTYGGIDVTGIAPICSRWEGHATESEVEEALLHLREYSWSKPSWIFDVIVSVGLLSQLMEFIVNAMGHQHPRLIELLSVVRLRHLQLMMETVRPGGHVVLVFEIVSSSTCPALAQYSGRELSVLLRQLIEQRNFFTGMNPAAIVGQWRADPVLARLTASLECSEPWIWDFGPRQYACCAVHAVRRTETDFPSPH